MGYDEEVDKTIQITRLTGGASSSILRIDFELFRVEIRLELSEIHVGMQNSPKGHGVR
jgi:hypothetical protein